MLLPRASGTSSAATAGASLHRRPVRPDASQGGVRRAHEPARRRGGVDEALAGADVFIGLSRPGAVTRGHQLDGATARSCSRWRTRRPEVLPEEIEDSVAVVGDGPLATIRTRSTTSSPSPGCSAARSTCARRTITERMELAAARRSPPSIEPEQRSADYVIPSVFNREVASAVADAVAAAAEEDGVARRSRLGGFLIVNDEHRDRARLQHVVADASE